MTARRGAAAWRDCGSEDLRLVILSHWLLASHHTSLCRSAFLTDAASNGGQSDSSKAVIIMNANSIMQNVNKV